MAIEDCPKYKTKALLQSLQERQSLQLEGTGHESEKFTCLWSEDNEAVSSLRLRSNDLGELGCLPGLSNTT